MGNVGRRFVMTPAEAKSEKETLWKNHGEALTDKKHPEHAALSARLKELQDIEFGNTTETGLKVM